MTYCYKVSETEVLVTQEDGVCKSATMCDIVNKTCKDIPLPSTMVSHIISHCPKIGRLDV